MPGGQPGLLSWPSTAQEQFSAHKGIGLQGASCGHRKAGTEHQRIQYPLNACLAHSRLANQGLIPAPGRQGSGTAAIFEYSGPNEHVERKPCPSSIDWKQEEASSKRTALSPKRLLAVARHHLVHRHAGAILIGDNPSILHANFLHIGP